MNSRAFGWLLGAVLAGVAPTVPVFAQEAVPEHAKAGRGKAGAVAERTVSEWIEELGADSYKRRVRAEQALRECGKDALPALQKVAKSTSDPEVQWRSKRLVRQIKQGRKAGEVEARVPGRRPATSTPDRRSERSGLQARDQFEDVFRRMERDFGVDIPRRRFFADDFFKDLDQQFRDMRDLQGRKQAMSQGMSMQVGPDGVRVEVMEKNADGELEKKVYEAKDMDSFKEQYPDVLEGNGLSFDPSPFGWRSFKGSPWGSVPFQEKDLPKSWQPFLQQRVDAFGWPGVVPAPHAFDPQLPVDAFGQVAQPVAGERLGVRIREEIAPAVRQFLALEDGVGLMIESVQDGTLAAQLKLEQGDIVTKIGGEAIGSPADVRRALRAIPKGKDVHVQWIRRGHRCEDCTKKRHTAPEAAAPKGGVSGSKSVRRSELKKANEGKRIVR